MHHRSLVFFAAGGVLLALAGHAIAQPATEPLPTEQPDEDAAAPAQPAPAPPARPLPATPPGDAGGPGITVPPGAGQGQGVGGAEPAPRATEPAGEERVFAEDWWTEARPLLELHGYFRLRAELFHNFSLGRVDRPEDALWPMPADNFYRRDAQAFGPQTLCTPDEAGTGSSDDPRGELVPCRNRTQAGANLRFRLAPELHVSGNLRVLSQIDILDNLVLGSTPEGYANDPSADGWAVAERNRYTPVGFTDTTTAAPRTGVNSLRDSIAVKRAWAEYATPVGELRFGRMPAHWGLGILHNSGDGFDDDYQTTIDRLQFVTGVRPLDLYVAGSWDFPNEGQTSEVQGYPQGQPYDVAQLDDVDQYTLAVFRRMSPELERLSLARGNLVLNGGVYLIHRNQTLANDRTGTCDQVEGAAALGCAPGEGGGFVRRGASVWIPDVWVQLRYRKFRFELEAVTVQGSVENISNEQFVDAPGDRDWNISQYGVATEFEQLLVEDKLRLGFGFGWASGDADEQSLEPRPLTIGTQAGDDTFSAFRFHPNYRVDLILHRNLLSGVQSTYYFRPSVEYDFMRSIDGQRLGGAFAFIWSRASEFMQAPGNRRDLGVELNGTLYFQSKDGALNDRPGEMGGFYTMLQYGVMFPLGGLGYLANEQATSELNTPQTLRWYLGVLF